jgi:poly-gamma-glutamate synthesis protein (capsule biosynthesis protein)
MKQDIKKAKENADFVIVFPHWGTEYQFYADKKQKELTKFFAEQGVNLVIGTHPHVIEPVDLVEQKDGQKMLVYYSLGNYISYQKKAPRMLGAMAEVTLTKTNSKVRISQASITPIVTHYEKRKNYNFGTFKLSDYTQEQAQKHGVIEKEYNSKFSLQYLRNYPQKYWETGRKLT